MNIGNMRTERHGRGRPILLAAILPALALTALTFVGIYPEPKKAPALPITIVAIDDASLAQEGPWPWRRTVHTRLVDRLVAEGARSVTFDVAFDTHSRIRADDEAFAAALGRARIPVAISATPPTADGPSSFPIPELAAEARVVTAAGIADDDGVIRHVPLTMEVSGRGLPSIAANLAHMTGRGDTRVAWDVDAKRIPTVSARMVLSGQADPKSIRGRDVVVAAAAPSLGDEKIAPDGSRVPGAVVQILAAEGSD